MHHIFLTSAGRALPRWLAAFPEMTLCEHFCADEDADRSALYWLELEAAVGIAQTNADIRTEDVDATASLFKGSRLQDEQGGGRAMLKSLASAGARVVALSATPSEREAFLCLSLGARAYCHSQAAPAQLREVAATVADGRLWMPRELVSRISDLAGRVDEPRPGSTADLSSLTPREEQVAMMVGRGFNNREIADALAVSERTVKANLTTTFEKLGLRDRVQLALYVNRLPIH